jgi:hypothetical protein
MGRTREAAVNQDNLVLSTIYVDPDIDEHLRGQEALLGMCKAMLFRRYLAAGMKAARTRPDLLPAAYSDQARPPLVLKTIYLDAKVDSRLRAEAFDARTPKNDLVRRYVRLGMTLEAAQGASHP